MLPLLIAMYKGDERARTMDIYVDDAKATTWTSSGSTAAFENVELGVAGQSIELRAVLGDSEWISITEVGAERWGVLGVMIDPTASVCRTTTRFSYATT